MYRGKATPVPLDDFEAFSSFEHDATWTVSWFKLCEDQRVVASLNPSLQSVLPFSTEGSILSRTQSFWPSNRPRAMQDSDDEADSSDEDTMDSGYSSGGDDDEEDNFSDNQDFELMMFLITSRKKGETKRLKRTCLGAPRTHISPRQRVSHGWSARKRNSNYHRILQRGFHCRQPNASVINEHVPPRPILMCSGCQSKHCKINKIQSIPGAPQFYD